MILRSRALWASKGCVIGDAAVRVRGDRIAGVGGYRDLPPDEGEPVVDIGESIIFPAFVNAHCHLEYSGLSGEISRDLSFTGWLNQIITIKNWISMNRNKNIFSFCIDTNCIIIISLNLNKNFFN